VNRYDCRDLLPLYYYELRYLFATTYDDDDDDGNDGISTSLTKALASLETEDGVFATGNGGNGVPGAASDTDDPTQTPAWIVIVSVIGIVLVVGVGGAALFVRRERRRVVEEKKFRKEQRREKREARKREKEQKACLDGDDLENGEKKTKKATKSKKTKKKRKEAREVRKHDVDDEGNYVGDDEHEDGKKPRRKSKQSTGSDSESHDSEIERLFRDAQDLSGKSPTDGKAKNSRKVKRGASKSSKSQETSTVTPLEESVRSTTADGSRDEFLPRDRSNDEVDPPKDIHMRNDPLQKGVSEVTISLAASLRTSGTVMPNQLEGIRDQERSDIDGDESEANVETGVAKKRKSKKAESPSEEIKADERGKRKKGEKKGHAKKVDRRVMLRAMSSIRASLTKFAVADLESSSSDDLNSSSEEDDSENDEEKWVVASKKKTPNMGKSSSEVSGRNERRNRGNNDLRRSGRRQAMMKAMASVRSSLTNFGGADSKSNKPNDKHGDIRSAEENETPKPAKRLSKRTSKSTGKPDPPDSNGSEPKKARPSFKSKAQSLRSSLTKLVARDDDNDGDNSSSSDSDSSSSSSDSSDGGNDRSRRPSLKKKPSAGKAPLLQDTMRRKSSTGSNANMIHSLSRKQSSKSRREFNSSYGSKTSSRGSKRDLGARSRSGRAMDTNGKRESNSSDADKAHDTVIPHKLSATDNISSRPYSNQQNKPKFLGRRASIDTKASESEQTRTNDYLPHGLDCQPHNLQPPPESSPRNEALLRSKSRGSKISLKSGSGKSLGSKSRSASDLNSAHGSVRSNLGSTRSKLSQDKSARSLAEESSKLSKSKKHAKSARAPRAKAHKRSEDSGKPLRRSKTRPSLEQFKSSFTNSVSSLKGKKLSKLAESALDSSEDHVAENPPKPSKAKSKKSSKKRPSTSQPTPENEVSSSRRSSRPSHSSRGGAREP